MTFLPWKAAVHWTNPPAGSEEEMVRCPAFADVITGDKQSAPEAMLLLLDRSKVTEHCTSYGIEATAWSMMTGGA